jgi:Tfp pilus assembly protein PilX
LAEVVLDENFIDQESRRMEDEFGYSRPRASVALVVGLMALALVTLLGVATVYMAMWLAILDKDNARLQAAQTELKDAVRALQASASAVPTVPDVPAPAPAAPPPAANAVPPSPTAAPATSATPAAQQAGQPQPAPAADRYSVRIFAAAAGTSNKNKLERFVNVIRSLGFDVDVSETNISDSMNSSILYQPSALNTANKLANSLKARYPALNFEMNTGAVNDNLKRVLILSLNQDALN